MDTLFVNASWKQYFLILAIVLGVFYLILFFLFSRKKRLSTGNSSTSNFQSNIAAKADPDRQDFSDDTSEQENGPRYNTKQGHEDHIQEYEPEDDDGAFDSLEELASRIEKVLLQGLPGTDKATLLTDLKSVLQVYPQLNKLPFRVAINNVIIKRAKQHCGIDVSDAEVEALWLVA
ncbi:hypothetical protein [Niastella sp. OAS944]|uniref:hypothetical protein n=1 Tax=Niastella sp. OAS944 TaxID=2664089 RepID=UPI003493239B|nr:cbb3-type cytochrome oxidase subunit 3 [Chitinophagaceae bacterium OAS944]